MKTIPVPVRLDKNIQSILRDGVRRTPHNRQDLIRLTLRLHLRDVIEQEAVPKSPRRVTNVDPLPDHVLEAAYRQMGNDWDEIEAAATRAQVVPHFDD